MRFLNLNLHFYPRSDGGATIVAERLAHGLSERGHEVTNVALGRRQADGRDFEGLDTQFGTALLLNGNRGANVFNGTEARDGLRLVWF